ncbi:MAG: GerMN domain-containing protein [Butyrivibrio sp.]
MKKIILFIFSLMLAVLATGCRNKDNISDKDSEYNIYYLYSDGITLITENYETDETDTNKLVKELLDKMLYPDSEEHLSVYRSNFNADRFIVEEKVVYVYFSDGYLIMNDVEEVLFRSALVKTLCQIEGIDYVSFYIKEQPLTNDSGNVIGLMSAVDFIESTDDSLDNLQWSEMTLYFADDAGQNLVCEKKKVAYKKNVSIEQAVLENLIAGPDVEGAKRTLPKGLRIIGVSVKDGICYVNFDSSFLNAMVDVSADVTIYSIVNSLCELPNIKQVQILVNGSSEKTFMDKYPLTTLFGRELNLVTDVYELPEEE